MTPSSPQKLVSEPRRNTWPCSTSSRWDFGKGAKMTEIVPVRDWLAELTTLGEACDAVNFLRVAKQAPAELEAHIISLAGDNFENGAAWATAFFKNPLVQPEDEKSAQQVPEPAAPEPRSRPASDLRARLNQASAKPSGIVIPAKPEPEVAKEPVEPVAQTLPAIIPPAPPPLAPNYDDALEAMNNRHAIIDNVGSKSVIASWEPSSRDQS